MKKFLAIIFISWKQLYNYKSNLFTSFLIGNIGLIGLYFLWQAILNSNNGSLDNNNIMTYVIIALILKQCIESFGIEWNISEDINSGRLNNLLQYPIQYNTYLILLLIGEKTLNILLRVPILCLILYYIRESLVFPDIFNLLLFIVSSILAFFIHSFITLTIGFLSFWFIEVSGFFYLGNLISTLLSGAIIPLYLLPSKLMLFLKYLPYCYIIFFPINIFTGRMTNQAIIEGILIQFFWVVVLYFLSTFIYNKGLKVYEDFGG